LAFLQNFDKETGVVSQQELKNGSCMSKAAGNAITGAIPNRAGSDRFSLYLSLSLTPSITRSLKRAARFRHLQKRPCFPIGKQSRFAVFSP